ncbi:MAG TPA: ABC transporter ATP-binding protein [Firmicutes bacterium]|nr:ABC transporter ATP-binding protein [Bacillota bacterium]
MPILEVKHLYKSYPTFELKDVNFSLEPGYIMGFIGKNGAGKTTTIKSIYNLVKKDSGEIYLLGKKVEDYSEIELKQSVALMLGGMNIYSNSKIEVIGEVVSKFYKNFNKGIYESLLKKFNLDKSKKFKELSNGMKTKFLLTLSMSFDAKLLILDEPTSGLDPFSRDEILEVFQKYIEDGKHSILFSTQIISDLEQIADYITYIKDGKIVLSDEKEKFCDFYRLINCSKEDGEKIPVSMLLGKRESDFSFQALIKKEDEHKLPYGVEVILPTIEQIMIMIERGIKNESIN